MSHTSAPPNKAFCIMPWIHVQVRQNAELYPCCRISHGFSYGNIKDKTIDEVWNSETIKKVRREMLAGKPQSFCSDCVKLEDFGSVSYRNVINHEFKNEFTRIGETDEGGFLKNNTIPYLDLRFSNVCNLKCRTCNSESSSSWAEDEKKLNPERTQAPGFSYIYKLKNINPEIITQIYEKLSSVTSIYFAGGEPLLDENHYLLLEKLIELKRTDVIISYNTNLSVLKFKKWNALALWKQFEHVQVSASIDAIGPALELIRKGADWGEIQKNLKLIRLFLPNSLIVIYPTISILNCFKITELIDYFLKNNYIRIARQIKFNILNEPEHLNICLLTANEIKRLESHFNEFILGIRSSYSPAICDYLADELALIIKFARSNDLQNFRPIFAEETRKIDVIRNENSAQTLTELTAILNTAKSNTNL